MVQQENGEGMETLPDRISATFAGKTVFITGGTGFIGKVLVEKLLRKCPDIVQIILFIRTKKDKTPQQRLQIIFNDPLFEQVASMRGGLNKLLEKIKVVEGDASAPDLGIRSSDRQYITDNVDIIVHAAATVRFDEPLKTAVILNVRCTKLVLELAKECKHLKLFVHLSTAYCHPHENLLEEKAYPPPADPHKVIAAAELFDVDTLETMAPNFRKTYPNYYAYTKALSESLAVDAMESLPVIILRPSIVIPILWEPLPGWTDNINGPTGLLIGAGKGVIRSMYCHSNSYADYVPVDVVVSSIFAFAWNYLSNGDIKTRIYNCTSSAEVKVTWHELIATGKDITVNKLPLNGVVWYPGGSMKHNKLYHNICVLLFHWIPAILVDTLLILLRQKPVLMRVYRRIHKGFQVLEYYTTNQWDFKSDAIQWLRKKLNEREKKAYKMDTDDIVLSKYFEMCLYGARRYILKTPDDMIPAAKRHMYILWIVDKIFRILFWGLLIYYILKWTSFFSTSTTVQELIH